MEQKLKIKVLPDLLSVCQVECLTEQDIEKSFYFIGKTEEEISVVCRTKEVPDRTVNREDGWRGFRIEGVLDFSLIGILSRIAGILAERKISIFAVSTYNTDYVLVKEEKLEEALLALRENAFLIKNDETER